MLTTLLLAAALDMPPQPPGFQPKTVALSPKQTELNVSLGSPMLKLAAPVSMVTLTGFTITNITLAAGNVSMSWQNGTAPFQVEGRTALDAPWSTLGNSLVGWSKTFPAAQNHYWRIKGNIVLPLNLNPTQPRLTWQPPDIMSDSLQQYTLQQRQTLPPTGQAISDDAGWSLVSNPAANATSATDTTAPPVWYRLKQTTANGVVVPFNIPSLTSVGAITLNVNQLTSFQPRLTWAAPVLAPGDALNEYVLQYRQSAPPVNQPLSSDSGWAPSTVTPSPHPGDTSASDTTPAPVWYRLKQTTINGNVIPFTIGYLPLVGSGACVIQRQFGGLTASAGSGIILKRGAVDSAGNLIIVGQFLYQVDCGSGPITTNQGSQDAIVAKFTSSGTCLWVKTFGNLSNDSANGVAVDSNDNILVIGSVSGSINPGAVLDFGFGPEPGFGGSDIMLVKYEPDGGVIWHKLFGGSGADTGIGVAIGPSDNIFITGTHGFFGTGANFGGGILPTYGQQDVFVAKLNTSGTHLWSKSWGGTNTDGVSRIDVDPSGNPIIGGSFQGAANFGTGTLTPVGARDGYLAKYSGVDGSALWVKQIGGAGDDIVNDIAVDSTGSAYALLDFSYPSQISFPGKTEIALQGGSFLIVKYDSSGTYAWSKAYGVDVLGPHSAGIGVDSANKVTVTGEMTSGIDFGTGWLLGQGGGDMFVLHFNADGTIAWAIRGAPFGDRGDAIAIHKTSGLIYALGDCGVESDFYQLNLSAATTVKTTGTRNNSFWATYQP